MFIDVHCHLDRENYGDISTLVKSCAEKGVGRIITVGFDLPSSRLAAEIAEEHEGVYFTAGFHPTELSKYKDGDLNIIADLCAHPKCVALGEIGLDYHYPDTQKELQRGVFIAQLELADRLKMPVQIHSRDCAEDMFSLLSEHRH
ncbi:MAG: TatD family hydrolase, partial [Clostridia bacterium]|nr:TatD family hydrolase [Clostridia bacterium]